MIGFPATRLVSSGLGIARRPIIFPRPTQFLRTQHFDTHQFVQRLEGEGLSRSQAEGIMTAISEVIDESVKNMSRNMVTKSDQEKYSYTQKVDFAQLKSEVQLLEKNDVALMKADNDRLVTDVERLKARLREEITRTQAGVRLDLNLEKGRIRDESSVQELKIREVDTRIESEISGLRTAIEQSKQNTLQYLVTVATGCAALLMAYMRFRM
ncbi:mitochondrial protein [Ceratobasidium sp. AG-I]|nr:mitochondrial protein [Ceratobasidium sp. AG-I]